MPMAKLEKTLNGNFAEILKKVEERVLDGSVSASLEDSCDWITANARCSVRVFERYSCMGGNRVSMSVTLFQVDNGPVKLCAITSGGSQAVFFKVIPWGEESFLETLAKIL